MSMSNNRYEQGLLKLKEVEGSAADQALLALHKAHPDLARFCIEYPMGDIYSRSELSVKMREVASIAALTVLDLPLQLGIHIQAGKKVGLTKLEIKEIILQMSIFCGFPRAINAMLSASQILDV